MRPPAPSAHRPPGQTAIKANLGDQTPASIPAPAPSPWRCPPAFTHHQPGPTVTPPPHTAALPPAAVPPHETGYPAQGTTSTGPDPAHPPPDPAHPPLHPPPPPQQDAPLPHPTPIRALPPGWESGTTPDGRTYYINHRNRTTHWKPPATGAGIGSAPYGNGRKKPWKKVLTQEQAREVYELRELQKTSTTICQELAKKYSVHSKTIRDIWNRASWVKATRPLWTHHEEWAHLVAPPRNGHHGALGGDVGGDINGDGGGVDGDGGGSGADGGGGGGGGEEESVVFARRFWFNGRGRGRGQGRGRGPRAPSFRSVLRLGSDAGGGGDTTAAQALKAVATTEMGADAGGGDDTAGSVVNAAAAALLQLAAGSGLGDSAAQCLC